MDADGLFTWQERHFQHPKLDLRGRCGTFGTFIDVRGKLAKKVGPWTPTVSYVAGVSLSAHQARFAWQAWYFRRLHRCLATKVGPWTPTVFMYVCMHVCMYVHGVAFN